MCVDANRDQKRALGPLELELQVVLTPCPSVWVLRNELLSSAREIPDFNHWASSPALAIFFKLRYNYDNFLSPPPPDHSHVPSFSPSQAHGLLLNNYR